jgi:hypothetical protein
LTDAMQSSSRARSLTVVPQCSQPPLQPGSGFLLIGDRKMHRKIIAVIRRTQEQDVAVPNRDLHIEHAH